MNVLTNKLKYLVKISLNKKIKTKWFAIVNVLLVVLIIGLVNIDTIISAFGGDFSKPTNIIVKDNTGEMYTTFKTGFGMSQSYLTKPDSIKIEESNKSKDELISDIKDNRNIVVIINNDELNLIQAEIISNGFIDNMLYQIITSSINASKVTVAMAKSNIDQQELASINAPVTINRNILDESNSEQEETMNFFMGIVFPIFILPFFMLIVFLVQMIGGEINEEKTTRSMEIIISNVSPKTHFISKILAANIFIFLQALITFTAGLIGFAVRKATSAPVGLGLDFDLGSIWEQVVSSGMAARLSYVIPITIILILLSFLAYSLIAGILASMTTSVEDFQQVQMPIILICVTAYYLAMLAPTFEGSMFIRIVSYLPFISTLISPPLLLIGQIGLIDVSISFILLIAAIYIMLKYGMKIYKVGILNYSTSKIWQKMFKAVRD